MTQMICSKCSSTENPFPSKGLVCKVCVKAYKRQNYLQNKETILEKTLSYYYENKDEISAKRKLKYKENPEPAKMRASKRRKEHPERVAESQRQSYQANPEPTKERSRRRRVEKPDLIKSDQLFRRYGISLADYNAMLTAQGGKCAICGATNTRNKRQKYFHVDHDHSTGKVRSLLCWPCNVGLGYFNDNAERLELAAAYLRTHNHGTR